MKLVIFGPPSAGKGTQAQKLSQRYGLPQVSTGDLLRKAVADHTPLGKKVKSFLDQGKLGPDPLIVELIKDRVSKPDCRNGYLLDGFPRTMNQAKELEKMTDIDLVLNIVVDQEILVERAVGRRSCPKVSGPSRTGAKTMLRRLWFERQTLLVVREDRLTESGAVEATIQYEDFRAIGGAEALSTASEGRLLRPFKILLEDGKGQGSVEVTFHEMIPNQPLKATDLGQV